jgi:tyrosine-protein kinase Etk/Wzc
MSITEQSAEMDIQHQSKEPPSDSKVADAPELSVVKGLIVLARHKKKLLGAPLASALAGAVIAFLLPNVYQATAKLLPPQQQQSSAAALLSQLGGVAGAVAGGAGIKSPNDIYIGMLRSRTVADAIIAKYDLKKVYGFSSQERIRNKLEENTAVASGKDGLITITVADENKALVAKLANSYVDELVRLTNTLAVTEASQRRVFYERQLDRAKDNLASAEQALKSALDTHGVVSVDVESRAMLENIVRLRAGISAKQIELSSMNAFLTSANPEYHRVQEELSSLRAELSKLENGRVGADENTSPQKSAGLENIKLIRNVKYNQMLYELLAKQYEVARLDEAKDGLVVQVLDSAIEPERKSSPRRVLIAVVFAMAGLFLTLLWIFAVEAKRSLVRLPGGAAKWDELRNLLKN